MAVYRLVIWVAALSFPGLGAEELVRLFVPVPEGKVATVRWNGERVRDLRVLSGRGVKTLVVVAPKDGKTAAADALYGELRAARALDSWKDSTEVWGMGWEDRHLRSAVFPWGRVAVLRETPEETEYLPGGSDVLESAALEAIARRFSSGGPVRVFWLGTSVDPHRGEEKLTGPFHWAGTYAEKPRAAYWEALGKAGVTVFPVLVDERAERRPAKTKRWNGEWSEHWGGFYSAVPQRQGAALAEAMARSEEGSVVEFRIHGKTYGAMGRAPKLEILTKERERVYERRLVVGGDAVALDDLQTLMTRVVEPLAVEKTEVVRVCGGVESRGTERMFRLRAAGLGSGVAWVSTTGADRKILEPGKRMELRPVGGDVCVGPVAVAPGGDVNLLIEGLGKLLQFRLGL